MALEDVSQHTNVSSSYSRTGPPLFHGPHTHPPEETHSRGLLFLRDTEVRTPVVAEHTGEIVLSADANIIDRRGVSIDSRGHRDFACICCSPLEMKMSLI